MSKTSNGKAKRQLRVQRVVRPSEAYDHLAKQMAEIERDFINGSSVIRLTHKYSLPLKCVETVLRMKLMARRPNAESSHAGPVTPGLG